MPLLIRRPPAVFLPEDRALSPAFREAGSLGSAADWRSRPGWFGVCANARCGSGWLHLLRGRTAPIFEGGWTCSASCTATRLALAVGRELEGRAAESERHRHRVPLGLLMLEQGWITPEQLRHALEAQKAAGAGRVGDWLVGQQSVSERQVTRALGLQWGCPVLSLESHDAEAAAPFVPRVFLDAYGALPLRVAAGRLLYLGFEDRLDPVLALAVERMTGLEVESGLVASSQFRTAHARLLDATFPRAELIETASESALVKVLARAIERFKPCDARLVRMHDCLWLRMWSHPQPPGQPDRDSIRDLICSVGAL